MSILIILVIGLVIGALAKFLMPGGAPHGIIITMLLGIGGAFLANYIGHEVGWYHNPYQGPGIIASVLGAMVIIAIYQAIYRRRSY